MADCLTVYVSIGNSDDKLSQRQWSEFIGHVRDVLTRDAEIVHGQWYSDPLSPYQNACWCVVLGHHRAEVVKSALADWAGYYGQDSIAWAEVKDTEFIPGNADAGAEP